MTHGYLDRATSRAMLKNSTFIATPPTVHVPEIILHGFRKQTYNKRVSDDIVSIPDN
jgi:hypothetical protein